MALLPAVSSCHSPACLKGKEKNLFHCSKAETLMLKILRLFSYLFCSLCFYICLFGFDHCEDSQIKKKKKKRKKKVILNGCHLVSMFVCLQIVNNKLSPLRYWVMRNATSSVGKIIRTNVQSIITPSLFLRNKTAQRWS